MTVNNIIIKGGEHSSYVKLSEAPELSMVMFDDCATGVVITHLFEYTVIIQESGIIKIGGNSQIEVSVLHEDMHVEISPF